MGQPLSKSARTQNDGQNSEAKKEVHGSSTEEATMSKSAPAHQRSCRAPASRRFAHPCSCQPNHRFHPNSVNSPGNPQTAGYTLPLHLYDPVSRKCLPTTKGRDRLLKECRVIASRHSSSHQLNHGSCGSEDLVCDPRRSRCVCKQSLHLYYESNYTTFGCVPIDRNVGIDGRTACKPGYIYNVISKECQKMFDVSELPLTQTPGVSATQFSFFTIVLIWVLLLILIVSAKLRKIRTPNAYRSTSDTERRLFRGDTFRPQNHAGASAWLHPFITVVNGPNLLNQHRSTVDRHARALDDSSYFGDTDFFLSNSNRHTNELFSGGAHVGSLQSLSNPPPKFEEIYPSSLAGPPREDIQPPSNEDLPTYDEAMKLQNTSLPILNQKEQRD